MEKEHRKALREQYQNRKPTMGIVALTHGDELWIATSTDAAADQALSPTPGALGSSSVLVRAERDSLTHPFTKPFSKPLVCCGGLG